MRSASDVIIPPVLYVPVRVGDDGGQVPVVRRVKDGRSALLAYTALDRLADQCGDRQPWVLVSTSQLGTMRDDHPFDVVAFDAQLPASLLAAGRLA